MKDKTGYNFSFILSIVLMCIIVVPAFASLDSIMLLPVGEYGEQSSWTVYQEGIFDSINDTWQQSNYYNAADISHTISDLNWWYGFDFEAWLNSSKFFSLSLSMGYKWSEKATFEYRYSNWFDEGLDDFLIADMRLSAFPVGFGLNFHIPIAYGVMLIGIGVKGSVSRINLNMNYNQDINFGTAENSFIQKGHGYGVAGGPRVFFRWRFSKRWAIIAIADYQFGKSFAFSAYDDITDEKLTLYSFEEKHPQTGEYYTKWEWLSNTEMYEYRSDETTYRNVEALNIDLSSMQLRIGIMFQLL